jgi:spore coat polysaccharide biosynthesis protein SpsF (cytidylyltransferase family)
VEEAHATMIAATFHETGRLREYVREHYGKVVMKMSNHHVLQRYVDVVASSSRASHLDARGVQVA